MPLTRDFKETVRARAEHSREFRVALLKEAVEAFIQGDTETGKTMLRDYVNATGKRDRLSLEDETLTGYRLVLLPDSIEIFDSEDELVKEINTYQP
jgi:hypothetical protein